MIRLFFFLVGLCGLSAVAQEFELQRAQSVLIPKAETGADAFLEKIPNYDGLGVVIAVFDTGVDPAALGLQTTTTGERKIVDIIDGSGAGDVDTTHTVELSELDVPGEVEGLSGRTLILPEGFNPANGTFRLGLKAGRELFHTQVWRRIMAERAQHYELELNAIRAERKEAQRRAEAAGEREIFSKHRDDLTLAEQDAVLREEILEILEDGYLDKELGPYFDCLVWHDGEHFRVIVDTDEDGDLGEETVLRPFGVAGEYGRFADPVAATVGVQVYGDGDLLSIVTVSGSHGTHVAAIAAAHFPDEPHRSGVAPGARILSVKMGDIRIGGGSNLFGEMRAVASAARYGVDIMNASWGGASVFQDGSDLSAQLYDRLVRDYGVTAFVSAGNNGPGLSTLGSPGGEARRVIGVGAHVSPDMGKYLYALSRENPETAFGFTSRGPGKSGDLGVDICAPGGATASLASDSIRGSELYNGTSMSAPSASGVGALLISAAKQNGVSISPERIKTALMRTARLVESDPFAEGAGMIQALPAWEFLQARQDEAIWDVFFDIEASDDTYISGPGIYLRETLVDVERAFSVSVSPRLPEAASDTERYAFEADVVLKTSDPWIEAPTYLRLAAGAERFRVIVKRDWLPETVGAQLGFVRGYAAADPDGPALFEIPITVISPESLSHPEEHTHRLEEPVTLTAGAYHRIFLETPEVADHVAVKLRLRDDDTDVSKRMVVSIQSMAADVSFRQGSTRRFLTFEPGQEQTVETDVHPGEVVEVVVHQYWSTPGSTEVEMEVLFDGVGARETNLVFEKNRQLMPLRLLSAQTGEIHFSSELNRGLLARLPVETQILPGDDRMLFPEAPRIEEEYLPSILRQKFELTLDDDVTASLGFGRLFDVSELFGGDFYRIYHAEAGLIMAGSSWGDRSFDLPKGSITIYRDIVTFDASLLSGEEDRPLHLLLHQDFGSLAIYPDLVAAMEERASSSIDAESARYETVLLGHSANEKLEDLKVMPDAIMGELTAKNTDDSVLWQGTVVIQPGDVFGDVANQEAEPSEVKPDEDAVEAFEDSAFASALAFIEAHLDATEQMEIAKRDELIDTWKSERPESPKVSLVEANLIAHRLDLFPQDEDEAFAPADAEQESEEQNEERVTPPPTDDEQNAGRIQAIALLDRARELCGMDEVAAFFGAKPQLVPGSSEDEEMALLEQESEMNERREAIRSAWQIQLGLAVGAADEVAFRAVYSELKRWGGEEDDSVASYLSKYYQQQGFTGLMLEAISDELEDAPYDRGLWQDRIDAYENLGWERFAVRDRFTLKLRAQEPINLYAHFYHVCCYFLCFGLGLS